MTTEPANAAGATALPITLEDAGDPVRSTASSTRPLLTVEEFRLALGGAIGKNTLYELLRANRIRHVRLGRKILIPARELDEFPEREANLN